MAYAEPLALGVFALTYVLVSVGRVRRLRIDRAAASLFGGVLMVLVVGLAAEPTAIGTVLGSINLDVLLLLLGMLLLVAGLDAAGFFGWTAAKLILAAKDARHLLLLTLAATAFLSAIALNDAVVLLFTPTIVRACRLLRVSPVPYVVAVALAANVGSVATPMGNPQNAFIAVEASIPFASFAARLVPVALASLAVTAGLTLLLLRRRFRSGGDLVGNFRRDHLAAKIRAEGWDRPRNPRLFRLSLAVLVATFAAFVLSSFIGVRISLVALGGGASVLFLGSILAGTSSEDLLRRVDWSILVFFVGLFLVLGGLGATGTAASIDQALEQVTPGGLQDNVGLHVASSLLSNLVSNVPAVLLLAGPVGTLGLERLWLILASSSTLAGNATLLGAAANVIAVEVARREGVEVGFVDFLRLGVPVTIATLLVSIAIFAVG